jgi:RNA polymerase sigma factor (sigma-70 family)
MDELIEENMGLVITIVNSFHPKNQTERQDLIDAGRIGLWKGLTKYRKDTGNQISTYTWRPIRWAIIREIKQHRKDVPIADDTVLPVESGECLWEYYPSNITAEERQLVELRCQGFKFREICSIVDQSPSVVKNRFYKALGKIKEGNNA